MINLLEETKKMLKYNGYTLDDIEWVGTSLHYIDKKDFINDNFFQLTMLAIILAICITIFIASFNIV